MTGYRGNTEESGDERELSGTKMMSRMGRTRGRSTLPHMIFCATGDDKRCRVTALVGNSLPSSHESAKDEAMTREQALAFDHPMRASVRRILSAAISVCNQSDLMRAAKQLGLWVEGKISLPEGDQAAEMLSEIELFEPNQRGRRALDLSTDR